MLGFTSSRSPGRVEGGGRKDGNGRMGVGCRRGRGVEMCFGHPPGVRKAFSLEKAAQCGWALCCSDVQNKLL